MRGRQVLLVLVLAALLVEGSWLAAHPSSAGGQTSSLSALASSSRAGPSDPAPPPSAGTSDPISSSSEVAAPSLEPAATPLLARFMRLQRDLNETLSRQLRRVRRGEPGAAATVLLLSLVYGVVHALGPGHGKAVVASLFLGRQARLARGVGVGFLVSFLQILSSITAVAVLGLVLRHSSLAVAQGAVWIELVSYALVALLGLTMTLRALRVRIGHHHAWPRGPIGGAAGSELGGATGWGLVLAAGLTPCPSGIIVLLFALANNVFRVGVEACLTMAVGMGATVAVIAVATILVRRSALAPFRTRPRVFDWVGRSLALAGSTTLTVVGAVLLVGAWARLP